MTPHILDQSPITTSLSHHKLSLTVPSLRRPPNNCSCLALQCYVISAYRYPTLSTHLRLVTMSSTFLQLLRHKLPVVSSALPLAHTLTSPCDFVSQRSMLHLQQTAPNFSACQSPRSQFASTCSRAQQMIQRDTVPTRHATRPDLLTHVTTSTPHAQP